MNASSCPTAVDVVVAGGGPNGLFVAGELALAGVRVLVLERGDAEDREPRANGLVGEVVRLLDHRGLYERIAGRPGPPARAPRYFFGALDLDLGPASDADAPVRLLPVPQWRLRRHLAAWATGNGARVRYGHEVTGFVDDGTGVEVTIAGPDGTYQVPAAYLVAADGGRSAVRKATGIGFPGTTRTDVVSRIAHVSLPAGTLSGRGDLFVSGLGRLRAGFTRTETGLFASAVLEAGSPLVSTVEWGEQARGSAYGPDAADPLTLDELRASVRRVLGADLPVEAPAGPGPHQLRRVVGQNTRLADRYRSGRVLLLGDAAHVHSATGGPGLNLGLQDAANLGWKLAAVVRGDRPDAFLDTYEAERRPVGQRVLMQTLAQSALLAPGPEVTALRELFGELLDQRAVVAHLTGVMTGTEVRYPAPPGSPAATGRFVPDLTVATDDGLHRVADLVRDGRPLLLDLSGPYGAAAVADVAAGWSDRVRLVRGACELPPGPALLVRPDGFVAWCGSLDTDPEVDAAALRSALECCCGPARVPVG